MWLSKVFVVFLVLSCIGWVYESIYGVIVTHQWEKRGFLYGPVCPIYGAGGVGVVILGQMMRNPATGECRLEIWQVFLISCIGSAVLEYVTHWALEKRFHMYWWDYSNMPLNLNGRICLPASLLFGVVGVGGVFWLEPFLSRYSPMVPVMFAEFSALLLMALLAADITLTVTALTNFEKMVTSMEDNMNEYMTNVVDSVGGKLSIVGDKLEAVKSSFTEEDRERLRGFQMRLAVRNMNQLYRGAISRIQGFSSTATGSTKVRAAKLQQMVRTAWRKRI